MEVAASGPYDSFISYMQTELDDKINKNQGVFVPLWKAILKDTNITKWEVVDGLGKLTLDHAYYARKKNGRTWYLEKEIHLKVNGDKHQIIFPVAKEAHDKKQSANPDKDYNTLWAWEKVDMVVTTKLFHGAGYSIRYDMAKQEFRCDNIHNAPEMFASQATPLIIKPESFVHIWENRKKEMRKNT